MHYFPSEYFFDGDSFSWLPFSSGYPRIFISVVSRSWSLWIFHLTNYFKEDSSTRSHRVVIKKCITLFCEFNYIPYQFQFLHIHLWRIIICQLKMNLTAFSNFVHLCLSYLLITLLSFTLWNETLTFRSLILTGWVTIYLFYLEHHPRAFYFWSV